MFYLTMHSTHFIYGIGHMVKEGNVLFNNALNTFYLWNRTNGKGRKEMLYLTTHSNTFYLWCRTYGKGRTFLFNNALNTF